MTEEPAPEYLFKVQVLAQSLLEDQCVIFLGAGASRSDIGSEPSLPSATQLASEMATACHLDFPAYLPLSTIAFYFEFFFNRSFLNEFLRERIDRSDVPIPPTIRYVAEIVAHLERLGKTCFLITTNYDRLFERAYEAITGTQASVVVYRGAWDPHDRNAQLHTGLNVDAEFWRPTHRTTLYKMHGCIRDIDHNTRSLPHLVITEDDYINFLANALSQDHDKRLLQHVRGLIALSNILFLGYSLADSNFRVVFKATAESRKHDSYAVQYFDESGPATTKLDRARWDSTRNFWRDKKVQIINMRASAFAHDLLNELKKRTRP